MLQQSLLAEKRLFCHPSRMQYATNRRAPFDYTLLKTFQAGMILSGEQASAIRNHKASLHACYVVWQNNRLELINLSLGEKQANVPLLLSSEEIRHIKSAIQTKGLTVVALSIHPLKRWIKVSIAIARGKKVYDKKDTIKSRDLDRLERKGLL